MRKIVLIQEENKRGAKVSDYIHRWNESNESFQIVDETTLSEHLDSDILFINVALDNGWFQILQTNLIERPDLNICFFIEPKELDLSFYIQQLEEDFPFSNIGVIIKPTHYGLVDKFLRSVINKKDMIEFDDNWDDISFPNKDE